MLLVSSMELPAVEGAAQMLSVPAVSAPPALDFEDEDDDLPRPGKVWDSSGPSLKELLAREAARSAPVQAEIAAAPPADSFANVEPVNTNDLGALWTTLLAMMAEHGPMFHSLISNGSLKAIEDGQAVIRYTKKNETFRKMLERNGKKDLVRDGLSKIIGKPMGVRFEVDDTPEAEAAAPPKAAAPVARAARPAPPAEPAQPAGPPAIRITPELIEQLKQDPLAGSVMDKFGATPVKIE
jgi:hypothetical protein